MTVPYLGSKISLISKAEIRYEGILYSIDQNESTVALAKVKSFGTEDRPTDRPVPPRDEVFEYIIFRGRDIKDLHVCAPPQPMPHDPAIVQSSDLITTPNNTNNNNSALSPSINPNIMGSYQNPQSSGIPPSQMMMYPSYVSHPPPPGLTPPQKPQGVEESPRLLAPIGHPSSNKSLPGQQSDLNLPYGQNLSGLQAGANYGAPSSSTYETPNDGVYSSSGAGHQGGYQSKDFSEESQSTALNNEMGNSRDGGSSYRTADDGKTRTGYPQKLPEVPKQSRYPGAPSHNQHYYQNQQYTSSHYRQYPSKAVFDQSAEYYRGGRGHPRGGFRRSGGPRGAGNRLKFEGEFDFESSNAQFDKEQIEKEIKEKLTLGGSTSSAPSTSSNHVNDDVEEDEEDGTSPQQAAVFYDKSKSFFDNLSSDATERERGRPNWREERKLNCETFGLPNAYGGYHRGGRGYRSRPSNHYYGGGNRGWNHSGRGFSGDRGFNRGAGANRRGRFNNQPQDRT